jgi:UDP-N-acetylmuramyl pentapeptide phosphotransferase/UDP-N-acetylglucosamine-1-phosphate transferase
LGLATGFLPWNFPTARVFLGDSGSYLLGALIALLVTFGLSRGGSPLVLLAPGVVYSIDTGTTVIRRLAQRKNIFQAHREHTYQRLTDVLGSHVASAMLVAGVTALMCCLSLASAGLAPSMSVGAMALLGVTYLLLPRLLGDGR